MTLKLRMRIGIGLIVAATIAALVLTACGDASQESAPRATPRDPSDPRPADTALPAPTARPAADPAPALKAPAGVARANPPTYIDSDAGPNAGAVPRRARHRRPFEPGMAARDRNVGGGRETRRASATDTHAVARPR